MHSRIVFGIAAWLLGATTATAGSLLAVSLLGEGISGSSGQLLTQDAVNRELASEAAKASPSASPTGTPAAAASETPSSTRAATPSPVITSASPVPAPTAPPTSPGGTVLTSPGGEVVAACQAAGAYLISWSPLQGYGVDYVNRGPTATARVSFDSRTSRVTMVVSCSAGVPSATWYTHSGGDE